MISTMAFGSRDAIDIQRALERRELRSKQWRHGRTSWLALSPLGMIKQATPRQVLMQQFCNCGSCFSYPFLPFLDRRCLSCLFDHESPKVCSEHPFCFMSSMMFCDVLWSKSGSYHPCALSHVAVLVTRESAMGRSSKQC